MNKFDEIEVIIQRYLLNESTKEEREVLLEWLSLSNENIQAFYTEKRLYDGIRTKSYKLPNLGKRKQKNFKPLVYWLSSVAAVVLFGLFILVENSGESEHLETSFISTAKVENVVLQDHSEVSLNRNSRINYTVNFETNRIVRLSGEAFFSVAKDSAHPFRVLTEDVMVTVLGTKFNVLSDSISQTTIVSVQEGLVEVQSLNGSNKVELKAGERAIYKTESRKLIATNVSNNNYLAWKTRKLVFKNTPLHVVASDLRSCYGVQIEFENDTIKNCKLTAKIDDYPIENVLQMLELAFNLKVSETVDSHYMLSGKGCEF